jgi:hypothetical protein
MKISKITWFILIIGIAVIGAAGLYMLYQDEMDEQDTLNDSIAAAQATLPTIIAERNSLEEQLAGLEVELTEAQALLTEAYTLFPDDVPSIYYGDVLFFWARALDIRVLGFTATGPFSLVDSGTNYTANTFTVAIVSEEVASIMNYLTILEYDDDFDTTRINAITATITQADPETEEPELHYADINITTLSYEGG